MADSSNSVNMNSSFEQVLRTCVRINNSSLSKGEEHCSRDKIPGGSLNQSSIGESNQELISQTAIKDNQIGPALKPVWKGNFKIKDSPSEMAFCEGIIAHPSAKVSRKAYAFSKQLDRNLQFTVYAQCQFSPHLFDAKCPDRDDIALYFYPSKNERSKKQYAVLLKFMKRKGFMLRSRIGAVELLVFPSTSLNADSIKLDGNYFMWGVFCHRKRELDAPCTPAPIVLNTSKK